jgi:hypothetical protein
MPCNFSEWSPIILILIALGSLKKKYKNYSLNYFPLFFLILFIYFIIIMADKSEYRIVVDGIDSDSDYDIGPDRFPPPGSDDKGPPQTTYSRHPAPTRDIHSFVPSVRPVNEVSLEVLPEPPGAPFPKKKGPNTIGTRIQALTKWTDGMLIPQVEAQTGVSQSAFYKLRSKAISRR